ncbi:MAG: dihydrodipicolinate reductase [Planctomycetota bacterium]
MKPISVVQIGLGPLGRKIAKFLAERPVFRIVGAVDTDPSLAGKTLGDLAEVKRLAVPVRASLKEALTGGKPDAVILTTVSDMARIVPQLEAILEFNLPVVSTCEELSFPWKTSPDLAARVDAAARRAGVAVLGTGVNPGYLMDTLPVCLTAVCQKVEAVRVSRIQDASVRRIPFQRKIGAGMSLDAFEAKRRTGTLRHVGLTESMHLIAARMGWTLDRTEDVLTPVVTKTRIVTEAMTIEAGQAAGVQQIGRGFAGGVERITLTFRAAIGEPHPEDAVEIAGTPPIRSVIPGGVNGDIATCAITLNAIPRILEATPGLKTMIDVPIVSWFGE